MAKRTGQARRGQKEKSSPVGAGLPGRKVCNKHNIVDLLYTFQNEKSSTNERNFLKMENKFDIEREAERIEQDLDDMRKAGLKQITLSFFSGMANEREFIMAARHAIKARGYESVCEYEDGEILLIVRKVD